jgi:molecular chaperone GrpE
MSRIPIDDDPNLDPSQDEMNRSQAGTDGGPTDADVQTDLQQLRDEVTQLYERLARTQADYTNSRRRLEAEMDQRLEYANAQLIKALLPVIDSFERALAVDPAKTDSAAILKGMQIVHDQMMKVLGEHHVEEIAPEPGTPFDPARHEALMQQPDDKYAEPAVTQLLQKGYALRDRTLRPAQVAVSKTG